MRASRIALALWALLPGGAAVAEAQIAPSAAIVKAPDGLSLKASYFSPGKPGPGLLLLHECNRDRTAWAAFASKAAAAGFHVLTLDYRGYGESEGDRLLTPQQRAPIIAAKWPGDVDAAVDWLLSQPGVDRNRIGAGGASCGVNQAAQVARRHAGVKSLVLLSGSMTADAREYLSQSPGLPVLLAASLDDGNAVESMRWAAAWSAHPKTRFVEFNAAGHGTDMFGVEKGLEPMLLDWFGRYVRDAAETSTSTAAPGRQPSLQQAFWTALTQPGGIPRAREMYSDAKKKDPTLVVFPEAEMNAYGYELLQQGRTKDAIEVFRLNVDANPGSANTYDSLSDAHLADGSSDEALRLALKALEVLETDRRVGDEFRAGIRDSAQAKVRQLKK